MAKMNAYKVHEMRMWAKDIIIPMIGFATGYILSDEDKRDKVKEKFVQAKDWAISKVKR